MRHAELQLVAGNAYKEMVNKLEALEASKNAIVFVAVVREALRIEQLDNKKRDAGDGCL